MNRNYESAADAAYRDPHGAMQAKMQGAQSMLGTERQQTEFESLLGTLRQQSIELRSHIFQLRNRVSPQPESDGQDAVAYGSGYVGQGEEIRSILSETIRAVAELSKFA